MAALLPARSKATVHNNNKILLSSFANGALHVDKVKGFLKSARVRSKKAKNNNKKQPQRGLGVAQLEKLRLREEQKKRETAVRLAILQGQATDVLYPLRPISTDQNNSINCVTPVDQRSRSLKGFSPEHCQVLQGLLSARNGTQQTESFRFAPVAAPLSLGPLPTDGMVVELGLSTTMNSIHQSERTSLTPLPACNVWDTKSPVCSDCRAYNCRMPLCRESAAEEQLVDTSHHRCRTEFCCVPFEYRSAPLDNLAQQSRCNTHVLVKQQMWVPSLDEIAGELSSFQSNINDHTASSMKDKLTQFKRRSCAIVQAKLNDVQMTASSNDDKHPRISYPASHVNASMRGVCAVRRSQEQLIMDVDCSNGSLQLKKPEDGYNSSFHDFLALGISTRSARVRDPDKEFLTLGLASHSVQDSNVSHDMASNGSKKIEDMRTRLDERSSIENQTSNMTFVTKLVGSNVGRSNGSSMVRVAFATEDESLISRSSSPDITHGKIDLTLKL